jgi:predicted transcriptional regulator of viral defense system
MTGREKIIKYAKQRKVFRASDVEREFGLSRMYISRLVQEGQLERVGYGLYSLRDNNPTEQRSIVEIAAQVPAAVICLLSALRFHDLTTQNPFEVWIAIPRTTRYPQAISTGTRVIRFAQSVYEAGIEVHTIEGVDVKVYSAAKTIADCFYYQRTVGLDVCLEALRDAWSKREVTMDELVHFATVRNVKGTMLPYLNPLT